MRAMSSNVMPEPLAGLSADCGVLGAAIDDAPRRRRARRLRRCRIGRMREFAARVGANWPHQLDKNKGELNF